MSLSLPGRPAPHEYPAYAAKYVARVPEDDVLAALGASMRDTVAFVLAADPQRASQWRYEPGKWTLCEVIGHICDTERILAYRILRIARGDQTPLPSFDENAFAANAPYGHWTPEALAAELQTVRAASISLLAALPAEAWGRSGTASEHPVTVRGLAWFLCGHERHHLAILKERYSAVLAEGTPS